MSTTFQSNSRAVKQSISQKNVLATRLIMEAIVQEATPKTPFKRGELRSRVRRMLLGKRGELVWQAGYAAVQERGRRSGARPFTNYSTAGTGAHFAENAVRKVSANAQRFFR